MIFEKHYPINFERTNEIPLLSVPKQLERKCLQECMSMHVCPTQKVHNLTLGMPLSPLPVRVQRSLTSTNPQRARDGFRIIFFLTSMHVLY